MPIDPSIIGGIKQFKAPTAQDVMSLQELATRSQINQQTLEEKVRANQQQNALLQILQNPQSVGPDGAFTPETIAAVTRVAPEKGIALQQQSRAITLQNMSYLDKKMQIGRNWEEAGLNAYDRTLQQTGNKEEALKAFTSARSATIDEQERSGMLNIFSKSEIDAARQQQRDPEVTRAMVQGLGGKIEQPPKPEHVTFATKESPTGLGYIDPRTRQVLKDANGKVIPAPPTPTMIRAEMDTKGDYNKTGEEFLNTLPVQYRNLVKKTAAYEVDPKTFAVQQGQRERMLSWAAQYDPNFDQKEYNSRFQAVTRFNTGPQGNTVRSLNVAIQHMDTARRLGDALNNKDMVGFNAVAQEFAKQTGSPKPTNFEAVKDILADEVVKGVLGAAGGIEDRKAMASKIKTSSSPAQLNGALNSWTELLSGQVSGLKTQYESSTGRKDFDQKLNPRTREALAAVSKTGSIPEFATEAEAAAANLTPGTKVKIGGKTGTWH
jgi:hypothetical protein